MASRKPLSFTAPGFSDDLLGVVQVFEDFLRRAEGLLEDIVDAGEPLDGLVAACNRAMMKLVKSPGVRLRL